MKLIKVAGLVLAGLILMPTQAFAANAVLSDVFDGSEMRIDPLPGSCGGDSQLSYQDAGTFSVAADGTYLVADAFNLNGVDVTALIYDGPFDPANPENNLLTPFGIDTIDFIDLVGGASYRLVVQQWCSNREGAWAVTFSGPGNVTSDKVRMVPAMTEGLFTGADPTASTDCGNSQYHESGPMQVAESGRYYYTDILIEADVDACVQVYTAPFDPANPDANRVSPNNVVGYMDDFDSIDLEAGTDYYFVVQPLGTSVSGEYFYVLAPPAPFRINKALAGAWFDPETAGQGILLDVFDNANVMFLAWFTYDLERPDSNVTAMIGDPGHRWMTAQGAYEGGSADLPIYWNGGMVFDSPNPPTTGPDQDGSMTIEFHSCNRGTVSYDLGTANRTGEVPIQTAVDDHVELCKEITEVPGQPGPL
jgi:hypothetical protein